MAVHKLKTWHQFMWDIASSKKTFEVRQNDRDFKDGDELLFAGWDNDNNVFTGQEIQAKVTYILHGGHFGVNQGYVVMGIKVLDYNF